MNDQHTISDAIAATIARRNKARQELEQAEADLAAVGVNTLETPSGTHWGFAMLPEARLGDLRSATEAAVGAGCGETAAAGALSNVDRDEVRQAVLAAARQGMYQPGMAEALLSDLKAVKTAS